jgi:hypothetical protein
LRSSSRSRTRFPQRLILLAALVSVLAALLPIAPASAAAAYDPFFAQPVAVADLAPIVPSTSSNRAFGEAVGDFDEDGKSDIVSSRADGRIFFLKGNGSGGFAAPSLYPWKLETFNGWAFASGDVNGDGNLDVVWGSNAAGADSGAIVRVNDGDVRYLAGNGAGGFATTFNYVRSGITFNAGTLVADVGTDTGSVAVSDADGDGDQDIVAGSLDGTNSTVKILTNTGGVFTPATLISQPATCSTTTTVTCSPTYFPASTTQNSPWGLAFGDADGDGDKDLWVGDRALYVYLYRNSGTGTFTLQGGNTTLAGRPNVYLRHDSYRPAVGFTPSLASSDLNGDGKADLIVGLHSGTQTAASNTANDGVVLLNVSTPDGHAGFGPIGDIGASARGMSIDDVNNDGAKDIVGGEYDGKVMLLRQLPPIDSDSDGVSDYVDNSPNDPNAPRIDMNTDSSINYLDQLDNDFDTVLGDPEVPASWNRLGDPSDSDDDNDGSNDGSDNCGFVANGSQDDADSDGRGDACDPLDDRDQDGDGVPTGPKPGDPLYDESLAAKIKWSTGDTHFVIRIDALGRLFQNEFTQLMTDAASLSPAEWATKCWENYGAGDPVEQCGTGEGTSEQTLTLEGGKEVATSVVVIPRLLWTDPPVIDWINDRNDNPLLEVGQHGTYHFSNTFLGDWAGDPDKNFFSCETCGLTEAENFELLKVGFDTLMGNYDNGWVADSGATASSPKIDWNDSASQLLSYAPPFNASDTLSRKATAYLGFKAFSASAFEEDPTTFVGQFTSPEGSHHEEFDQFGMFHASADLELEPPETSGGSYDTAAYEDYLEASTDDGGLTTWLIEEVEWSGRPCNEADRLADPCPGFPNNRENNTVYGPRWDGWMQLLDYVKNYPGGVSMTMQEVALAEGFDNAPTVANPGQTDSDSDGVGDVIDGATLSADDATLSRNQAGDLSATLTDGAGDPIADQEVKFTYDTDGDSIDETFTDTTGASGVATVSVTTTRPVGSYSFSVDWNGGNNVTATDTGNVEVGDATSLTLDATPTSGQVTDAVTVGATLLDSDDAPMAGRVVSFSIGTANATGTTDAAGHASANITLTGPAGSKTLSASFAGGPGYGPSEDSRSFTVLKEDTNLSLADAVATRNGAAIARATLTQDGVALSGMTVRFFVQETVRKQTVWTSIGTAQTNASGVASLTVPTKYVSKNNRAIRAEFDGNVNYLASFDEAVTFKN